jgi:1-acyl-sn-glycerol-3-phosphate acyltransferase
MSLLYRLLHYWGVPLALLLWTRLRVEGAEYLPKHGPVIIISNHVDNWDTYVVGMRLRGRLINYLARPDGMRSRWLGRYWRRMGAIPADRDGLALALKILKAGGAVGVFPEGVIAPALVEAIPGSAVLALRSGAPVVPAAVWGTERIRPWSFLRRPRVVVRFGPPRAVKRARGQDSQAIADDLMREIASMLPEEYRGVYAPDVTDSNGNKQGATGGR